MNDDRDRIALARAALARAQDDPVTVEREMDAILAELTGPGPPSNPEVEAVQLARWARGRARLEQGRYAESLDDLQQAAAAAIERGDDVGRARIDVTAALAHYGGGDVDAARVCLDRAEPDLTGDEAGHLHLQRAIVQVHAGELVDARRSFDAAAERFERAGDGAALARCLASRGVAATYLGDLDAAAADLDRAVTLAGRSGQRLVAAGAIHNLGYVRARLGETPVALELFDRARRAYDELDSPGRVVAALAQDHAETLLFAGLADEACRAARDALDRHEASGATTAADETRLLVAEAELAAGHVDVARDVAEDAAARFDAAGRAPWAARATAVALGAGRAALDRSGAMATGTRPVPTGELLDRAIAAVAVLDRAGWVSEMTDLAVRGAGIAMADERDDDARLLLDRLTGATDGAGGSSSVGDRIRARHADGLRRLLDGDAHGALAAASDGMAVAASHRAALAACELRSGAAAHTVELARFGLRVALGNGRPELVFGWIEQARARALASAPGPPEPDPTLRAMLGRLRAAHAELRAEPDSRSARAAVVEHERAIRDHDHRATRPTSPDDGTADASGVIDLDVLRAALDGQRFLSYAELDGDLWCCAVDGEGVAVTHLGPVGPVRETIDGVRFAIGRLARAGPGRGTAAASDALSDGCRRLDEVLGTEALEDGPVVISASSSLHGLPWPALASMRYRPVTVTPSATVWGVARGDRAHDRPRGVGPPRLFVGAGPGLDFGRHEAEAVAAIHGGATVAAGDEVTVARLLDAFAGFDLVHLVCHGRFRTDSPLFSGLELADGLLTLFDLHEVGTTPSTVILPACHLASARVLGGDEPLGAVARLVELGTTTVIAPLGAVGDEATASLMVGLHRRLADGVAPAPALAAAAADALDSGEPSAVAAAASFLCSGRRA